MTDKKLELEMTAIALEAMAKVCQSRARPPLFMSAWYRFATEAKSIRDKIASETR